MIKSETIDKIKALTIYEVLSHYVADLKRSGATYCAKSPFTNEKTASFYVVPSKNIFKCFSSGYGGDAVFFVMQLRGMSWIDAIKDIAGTCGIPIEYEESETPTQDQETREELYKINQATAQRYINALHNIDGTHPAFSELVNKRQFTPDTFIQWQIGWAPDEWQFLTAILKEKALIKPAKELGLVREKEQRIYDAFRSRVMFPIHNHQGRVVGFGGRALAHDSNTPKYLNSSESILFDKKKVLYGLHYAIASIRTRGYANLVEGYTDVISYHQAGQTNTVGTCGTSLTDDQCLLLKKYTNKVVLFPDPDAAGERSALRSMDLLMKYKFEVAIVPLPVVIQMPKFRELCRITHWNKKSIQFKPLNNPKKMYDEELTHVHEVVKIDPDEMVRMFHTDNVEL